MLSLFRRAHVVLVAAALIGIPVGVLAVSPNPGRYADLQMVTTISDGAPVASVARPLASPPDGYVDILNVGDSITGASNDAYRRQLSADLTAAGVSHRFAVRAVSGAPCGDLASQVPTWLAQTQPDVVLIYCGVNDARMGLSRVTTRAALKSMVGAAVAMTPRPAVYIAYISYANPVAPGIGFARVNAEAEVNNAVSDVITYDYPYVSAAINLVPVPGERLWKVTDGVHLTPLGEDATGREIARNAYFRMAVGATTPAPPSLCGMSGHGWWNPEPSFTPCAVVAP